MFTIDQIKETHSKVKSGADFPQYVQNLIDLGLIGYDHYVCDGHSKYYGKDNFQIQSEAKYALLEISLTGNIEALKNALKIHQAGETDYLTFCRQSAEAGVEKWTLDMKKMTCVYYDKNGLEMVTEVVPSI
ncbi:MULTISPECIES: DUF1398 family protein [unclassified Arcicella]|uniref:DUF1398 domain-containing protein n=1 Tax=unclassified Arcicella TaxID=2644986 RepID=UPI0028667069|nr:MULTISPECIES: DUF1398 family protein [unclassified Arcicella]MDR6560618.1 uncharacterized protein YbcV (DUF1398 family) [Arcicella sp. BE51]MDR6810502.1 uncharacterized protein YbcV (DUF1398 family) [Arcicella sp. BE140]MDR6821852.1 uncharacterized protein YbcV (DUF1398 family) [Arcicella sp. BE139]